MMRATTIQPDRAGSPARFWSLDVQGALDEVGSHATGLSATEAARRRERDGPNRIGGGHVHRGLRLFVAQFTSPIIVILAAATLISIVVGDLTDGAIILAIIAASGVLGFVQEHSAGRAVDALLARVQVEVEVLRDGAELALPTEEVVVGDVIVLRAGDIIPADCLVLTSDSLLVDESALTGESFPVEKTAGRVPADSAPARRTNAVFLGTHVVSGTATAVVMQVGRRTELGAVVAEIESAEVTTRFERGITAFGLLLVRAMVVLVSAIFVVNVVLHRPVVESLLFSLALAVGLTPQLLPAIVAVSLSTGARRMAAKQVIVKRLDAIEDFGAMTVLCTDKTGTLTAGAARLDHALDVTGRDSTNVLELARLNAGLQRGFPNPLDAAIVAGASPADGSRRIDEVPYDFERRLLSVLATTDAGPLLITKGAVAAVMSVSSTAEVDGAVVALDEARDRIDAHVERLSAQGCRVLGLATRALPDVVEAGADDETAMVFRGLLAFDDPPKAGVPEAIDEMAGLGISVRLITGDNHLAAGHVAAGVGLEASALLTGSEIDALDDAALADRSASVVVFAEVDPLQKERIVRALRAAGETVGFLGDGINDAAALDAADVGISVDTAVDVAKQSAAIVLLDKDLAVVAEGVRLGRETFANTLKYVRVTVSANFGNMLSMAAAAAFLPFLPLLPRQILLLNFLSDIPGTTIAADAVDAEQVERPRSWDIAGIRRFMIAFGLISSVFDIATFLVLRLGFDARPELFRSGWFLESTATELAVMLVLRTRRPFWRSRPGRALLGSSVLVAAVTVGLPYSPLAGTVGLVGVPAGILLVLAVLTTSYVAVNELVKRRIMVGS